MQPCCPAPSPGDRPVVPEGGRIAERDGDGGGAGHALGPRGGYDCHAHPRCHQGVQGGQFCHLDGDAGSESCLPAQAVSDLPQAEPGLEDHHRLRGQLGDRHLIASFEGMARRNRQTQPFAPERGPLHVVGARLGRDESDVDRSVTHLVHHGIAGRSVQLERGSGGELSVTVQEVGNQPAAEGMDESQRYGPSLRVDQGGDPFLAPVDLTHRPDGVRVEDLPVLVQTQSAVVTVEELDAQFALESGQGARQRRLADAEAQRGFRHVLGLGQGREPFEFAQQHDCSPWQVGAAPGPSPRPGSCT